MPEFKLYKNKENPKEIVEVEDCGECVVRNHSTHIPCLYMKNHPGTIEKHKSVISKKVFEKQYEQISYNGN